MRNNRIKIIAGAGGAIVLILIALLSIFVVETGEVGIVKHLGRVTRVEQPGLHFKIPILQGIEKMIVRERTIRFGFNEENQVIEASTRDMQSVKIELTMTNLVHDPQKLYQAFTGNHVHSLLVPRIRDAVQSNVAQYSIEQFVAQRSRLAQDIFNELKTELGSYGITVTNVSIVNHDFSDSYETAVENKKVAEQEVETEKQKQQKRIIEKEAEVRLSELNVTKKGLEAKANEIESKSLTPKLLLKIWIEKWDGKLPKVISDGTGLILTPETLEVDQP